MARKPPSPQLEEKVFRNVDEIDRAIAKLRGRIKDVEEVDFRAVVIGKTGAERAVESNIKATIREIFGPNSPRIPRAPIPRTVRWLLGIRYV
jgi:hypothetical protein